MAETDLDSAVSTDLTNALVDYAVASESTEGAEGDSETFAQNFDWPEDYGYYKNIPEFKTAVDTKATWVIGAGFETDDATKMLLMNIKGNGKDSFNSIIKNQYKVKTISRDSFAEIILDGSKTLRNLKPLDPGSMRIVQSKAGRIVRYEQMTKHQKVQHTFQPEEIFHLSHERCADEIQGTRIISALKWLILARNEAMSDWKRVLHRNISPLIIWHLDTDDTTEIAAFKNKTDKATALGENMYIPKGTVEPEIVSTAQNATLNPLAWINQLNDYFFQAVMVPQIIIGNAKEFTDASGKIVYLAYEQSVKAEQLYIEEQVLGQLNLEIELTFPASLQNDATSDTPTPEPQEQASQTNDTNTELEGKQ